MEGELQDRGQIDHYLDDWLSQRGIQLDRDLFSEEEKKESIQLEGSAPKGAMISNQGPEG